MAMSRQTFSKTESYHIEWEIRGGYFHLHCLVSKWRKSVLSSLYIEFARIREFARDLGHLYMFSLTPNIKFCQLFNGRSLGTYKQYEVMVWDLI